jgi:hypothetical protein
MFKRKIKTQFVLGLGASNTLFEQFDVQGLRSSASLLIVPDPDLNLAIGLSE